MFRMMHGRNLAFASVAFLFAASSAHAVNPPHGDATGLVLHSTLSDMAARDAVIVREAADVEPGQIFLITGDCVMMVDSASQLRVVLTLAGTLTNGQPGFRSVIATDQAMQGNALQVRVPNMPETANRVFDVKIFRLGEAIPQVCEAGSIRIGGATVHKVG
jgi:hypothetical protein